MNIVKLNIIEYNEVLITLWTYICDRWAFLKQYVVSFRWSNVLHALFKNAQLISRILEHNKNLISHVNTVGTYYKHCKKRIIHVIRTIRDLFLCINDPQINFTDGIYGLIHIVPCCQLVEQKSEQIVHFLLKTPYLQGVRFLTW